MVQQPTPKAKPKSKKSLKTLFESLETHIPPIDLQSKIMQGVINLNQNIETKDLERS